jgi:hypothetical protein
MKTFLNSLQLLSLQATFICLSGKIRLSHDHGDIRFIMNLKKMAWENVDWVRLAQGRDLDLWKVLMNMVVNLWVP